MYGLVLLLSLSYQLSFGYLQEFYTFDGPSLAIRMPP